MDLIKKHLHALDLTEEEISIYLNAIETGASTVLELAQNTAIPRTTVYLLIDSLVERGLMMMEIVGKKKKYTPVSPHELIALAQKKQDQYKQTAKALESDLPELQALYNLSLGKPRIMYFHGKKETKKIFDLSLNADKIYMHFMSSEGKSIFGTVGEAYFDAIGERMIVTQQIITESESNEQFKKNHSTSRNEVISLPPGFVTNTDYLLFADSVVFITYKNGEPVGILIEDPSISHFEKARFHMIWQMAAHYESLKSSV